MTEGGSLYTRRKSLRAAADSMTSCAWVKKLDPNSIVVEYIESRPIATF
jgi:hypothetical protein